VLTNLLDFAVLVIQVSSTVIMFFNAKKTSLRAPFSAPAIPTMPPRKRERRTKWGFFLLAVVLASGFCPW
jgi:hypothetical protein